MFTPFAFRGPQVSVVPPLLNYGTALVAYSVVRLLKSGYTGYAFKVRRSSDNTTQDIGFTGDGVLDTAALQTFVGANDGFVDTLYDQSGNGINLTQTTQVSQPKIVNSGTIISLGTSYDFPTMEFDGSNDWLEYTTAMTGDFKQVSIMSALNIRTDTANGIAWCNPSNGYGWGDYNSSTQVAIPLSSGVRVAEVSYTFNTPALADVFYNIDGGTNASYNKINQTTATATIVTGDFVTSEFDKINLGRYPASTHYSAINICEWCMFSSTQESNKSNLRQNMNDYYSFF